MSLLVMIGGCKTSHQSGDAQQLKEMDMRADPAGASKAASNLLRYYKFGVVPSYKTNLNGASQQCSRPHSSGETFRLPDPAEIRAVVLPLTKGQSRYAGLTVWTSAYNTIGSNSYYVTASLESGAMGSRESYETADVLCIVNVERPEWTSPSGRKWIVAMPASTNSGAWKRCQSLGATVPTQNDVRNVIAEGFASANANPDFGAFVYDLLPSVWVQGSSALGASLRADIVSLSPRSVSKSTVDALDFHGVLCVR